MSTEKGFVIEGNIRRSFRDQAQCTLNRGFTVFSQHWLKLERFVYDLEMKTREQNRKNKQTETERFDWFIERIQTRVAFGWLSERLGEKNFMPENFLEINQFSLVGKRRVHVLIFSSIGWVKRKSL